MSGVQLVVFDLSGTTIDDGTAVADCLFAAAQEFGMEVSHAEILPRIGTNKIHLYQYLLAKAAGRARDFRDFEREQDPEFLPRATEMFRRYEVLMLEHYQRGVTEMSGASETFRWCQERGIRVATDTGFHRTITEAIMEATGWVRTGLVNLSVDVQHVPGERGRPAPYMIFYAMQVLGIQSVHTVVKVGDQPADMLEGTNAGCRGVIGVTSGPVPVTEWGRCRHTHVIPSVKELPELLEAEFLT
jgi:phosphonatase-like hydrolase